MEVETTGISKKKFDQMAGSTKNSYLIVFIFVFDNGCVHQIHIEHHFLMAIG